MRTPLDPRRTTVDLAVATPDEPMADAGARIPYLPWLVAALAWTVAAVALGWVLVGALVSVAWLTAVHLPVPQVMSTIGQGWLALHGVPVALGGFDLGMTPLGLTLLVAVGVSLAAHHAAVQYGLAPGAGARARWLAWAAVTGACVGAYALTGGVVAAIVGSPSQVTAALPGLVLVPLVGAALGAGWGLDLDPTETGPTWVRRLPGAAAVGLGTLTAGSLIALVVALVAHRDAVVGLHDALTPDGVGAVLLAVVQLAYLPNLVLAAGSFVLGSGVSLGQGAIVAPGVAEPGLLPTIPVLGAVPTMPGVADLAWLVVGPVAGLASAWWLLRGTAPSLRHHGWQAAVAAAAMAGVWVAVSWLAVGDLGTERLVGLGPVFPDLLWWGTLPAVVAATLFGLGRSWWLSRRAAPAGGTDTG